MNATKEVKSSYSQSLNSTVDLADITILRVNSSTTQRLTSTGIPYMSHHNP